MSDQKMDLGWGQNASFSITVCGPKFATSGRRVRE